MRVIKAMLASLFLFNFIDAIGTYVMVESGLFHEGNPLMKVLIDYSPALFLFSKILLLALPVAFLYRIIDMYGLKKKTRDFLFATLIITNTFYIGVLSWNIYQLIHWTSLVCHGGCR